MSYNIDNVDATLTDAKILFKTLKSLNKKYESDLPERNFIEELLDEEPDSEGYVKIKDITWCATGSGRTYDVLTEKILPKTKGKMELIFTWEGGESISGLLVEDGKVTECNVEMTLVPIKEDK